MSRSVLVTGASGFIGQRLLQLPSPLTFVPVSLRGMSVEQVDFTNADAVVHLAGIAHRMDQPNGDIYYSVNRDLTMALASKAKLQGVSHFIFVSTVKVYGDSRSVLDQYAEPAPEDDYGRSKLEAERGLLALSGPDFTVAIIRPPLVYGPGVKGNILKLMQWISKGYPLPFKGVSNARSMVYVDNLVALMHVILEEKVSGIFIAGDKVPLCTSEVVRHLGEGLGVRPRLVALPGFVWNILGWFRPMVVRRLTGSYVVFNHETNERLGFRAPYTTREGLLATAQWFLQEKYQS